MNGCHCGNIPVEIELSRPSDISDAHGSHQAAPDKAQRWQELWFLAVSIIAQTQ